jgi:glycosyltransferase involved in cell wall biosynthesis
MKIAIDIRRARDFGAGTYTRNLIGALARLDRENAYALVGAEADGSELGALPGNFSLVEFESEGRGFGHDLRFDWLLERTGVDLLHTPYLTAPWMLPCPHVLTVHDTVDFLGLAADGNSLADLVQFHRTRRSLRRARRVLCVSEATRRDVQLLFGIQREKTEVFYNALDARLLATPPEDTKRVLGRYSIPGPYVLYAGNVKPHKNLTRLIEAFAIVKHDLRHQPRFAELKLVVIGDELSKHPQLRHAVLKSRMQAEVRFLGFVPPGILRVFYARAALFAFPSLYEGFGLPPLEAMSLGTPVVASNIPALVEVLGEAAHLVNPENVFDISRGLRQALLDDDLRRRLVARGREQVARFSWDDSVRRVLEVYRQVVAMAAA